jgi:predicted oxidoreductase
MNEYDTPAEEKPAVIYGCMNLGGSWDASPPDAHVREKAFSALDAAFAAGYTWYDHADIYCGGKSEGLFGEYLAQRRGPGRESIVIQSKLGIRFPGDGGPDEVGRYDLSRDYVLRSVEAILRRLQTDYLDILLFHRPDMLADGGEIGAAVETLYNRGMVRRFGISNHSPARLARLQSFCDRPLEINQVEFSLGHRHLIEGEIQWNQDTSAGTFAAAGSIDEFASSGVQLQAWSPLARGRYSGAPISPQSDPAAAACAKYVGELAGELGCSPEAVVLAWIRRIPGGIVPVIGSTDPRRIAACAEAGGVRLSREQWYRLLVLARGQAVP